MERQPRVLTTEEMVVVMWWGQTLIDSLELAREVVLDG